MSLTISAAFESCFAADRAVNLLRQHGIPARRTTASDASARFAPYPYDIHGVRTPEAVLPGQHALSLFQPSPSEPKRTLLTLSAEPPQLAQARAIIFRCGGTILS